jgi:nuclear transcription Y subunit beta
VTSEAAEICMNAKRTTITGEDILKALNKLGFEEYSDMIDEYNGRYKEAFRDF